MPVNLDYTLGTVNITNTTLSKGKANFTITGGNTSGTANATVTVNGYSINTPITVDNIIPTVTSTPSGGSYTQAQTVTLTASKSSTIYYTTDGSDPTINSAIYTSPITISSTTTLKYMAIDAAGNQSPIYTETYTMNISPNSYTWEQVVDAATRVKNYIETNKALSTTVTIGSSTVTINQFLYLATRATVLIFTDPLPNTLVTTGTYSSPSSSLDDLTSGKLSSSNYLDLAQRTADFMDNNNRAPTYGSSNLGKVGYNSLVYLYSRILAYYNTNGVLPPTVTVKAWSNIPIT